MKKRILTIFAVCFLFLTTACEEKIKDIKILKDLETINVGSKKTVKLQNKGNYNVVYSSSDENIAIVDSKGEIFGKSEGTATITASVAEGNQVVSMTVRVNSIEKVESITLGDLKENEIPAISTPQMSLYVDETKQVKATVLPEDAANKELYYKSRNDLVATVSQDGKITGKKAGKVVIIAQAKDGSGKKGLIEVTVSKKPRK